MDILYFDICAIIILVLVLTSTLFRKMTQGRTNKLFLFILLSSLAATVFDYLTGVYNNYVEPTTVNIMLNDVFNSMYFFFHGMIPPIYFLYCYSSMGIWHIVKHDLITHISLTAYYVMTWVMILINPFTHCLYYIDENCKYHRGSYIIVLYLLFAISTLMCLSIMIRYRRFLARKRFVVLASLVPLNIIAMILQTLVSGLLIEMFAISLEIILFIIVIQREEASVDPVTGAKRYNDNVVAIKGIMESHAPVTVILVKIVNNKNIRRYLGSDKYNAFIKSVSERLVNYSSEADFKRDIYYMEYGLFALMGERCTEAMAQKIGESISSYYSDLVPFENFEIQADVRTSVVFCPKDIDNYSTLSTFAFSFHKTLPQTKEVLYYRDYAEDRTFILKNELDNIIKRAISDDAFQMYYQPIYSVKEKKYVAAEALIRLYDKEYGDVSPSLFIPRAEVSGDIYRIGNFVFENVCRFISESSPEKVGIDKIQINLSPLQCAQLELADNLRNLLDKYKVDPCRIQLELTEEAADYDPDTVDSIVDQLHEMGISFVLDNYGSGYSNIKRVTELPIDVIKIDREFAMDEGNLEKSIVVEDSIVMLKNMGKEVLVQGIEEKKTAEKFENLGCDYLQGCEYMQGYYFSKALPEAAFIEFVKEYNYK